jgi:hypothetical protein
MDKIAAGLGLLLCALIALRLAVAPARRQRFDDACRRLYDKIRARLASRPRRAPTGQAVESDAARRQAEQLIERARQRRQDVEQNGNVIRPRAFDPSRKKPPLH